VFVAGQAVDGLLEVRTSDGWDQSVGTAEVVLVAPPPNWHYGDPVEIQSTTTYLYGQQSTNPEQTGSVTRFRGLLRHWDYSHWPRSVTLHAESELCRAADYKQADATTPLLSGRPGLELRDLLGTAAGGTLRQIAEAVLARCGVTQTLGGQDPPHVYGADPLAYEEFTWRFGESGLAYMHRVCEASALYRVFSSGDGNLYLYQILGRPNTTLDLPGAKATRSTDKSYNAVTVQGFDAGTPLGPLSQTVALANFDWSPDVALVYRVSSPMIEDDAFALELANAWIYEVDRELVEAEVPTWIENVMGPGQTHGVLDLDRLGTGEPLWVRKHGFSWKAQTGELTQTCAYVGGGQANSDPPVPIT
jgi:hypothetical protein